jgi:hypothetical protein
VRVSWVTEINSGETDTVINAEFLLSNEVTIEPI